MAIQVLLLFPVIAQAESSLLGPDNRFRLQAGLQLSESQNVEGTGSAESGNSGEPPLSTSDDVGGKKPDIVLTNVLQLSLTEVIQTTLNNNVSIAVQEYNSRIQRQNIINNEAAFDPSVNAEVRTQDDTLPVASAFANPPISKTDQQRWKVGLNQKLTFGTQYEFFYEGIRDGTNSLFAGLNPQYSTRFEVNLTQPLLKNFGQDVNRTNIYIAQNNLSISQYDFKSQVIDIITQAENVYWDLVFSQEDLKVKQQSVERARDLEQRVKAQVEVGTMAPLEILQAQAEVASREEAVINAEKLIKDNEDNLKNILNIAFDSEKGTKDIQPLDAPQYDPESKVNLDDAINQALSHRPDYLAKKKELDTRNIQVEFNENQTYPTLDLVASYGLNGITGDARAVSLGGPPRISQFGGTFGRGVERALSTDFDSWTAGVVFSYPLGNRAAESQLTAAKLEVAKLLLDIKDLEKTIIIEVREAVRKLETDIKRVQAARISRRLAEETLNAELKKFEVGLSTSFQVLEFQTDLAEEQSKELLAIIDFNKSRINFRKVIASTLNHHRIELAEEQNP
ncbi:TolC family protein [Nitrospina gracilis]|uniref:TolC family protein n=1 Tax=Nitrospina gracilis TaxID=35801 RepID=UPI001F1F20D6|nr:TolC family protein [Nitrospina gracilis]MCF8720641.1 outer membrane protein TolC [Nitrospina gracilis Nb-211]